MTHTDELDSSPNQTEEVVDTAQEASSEAVETRADEPTETATVEGENPKTMLDAVLEASKKSRESATPAEAEKKEEADNPESNPSDAEKSDADKDKETEVSPNDPLHKHPRFKQVTTERRQFKEKFEAASKQLSELEPDAKNYRHLTSWMQSNNLSADEVEEGMQIMAAMKHDPTRALKLLAPHLQSLQSFTGEILPPEIAAKVEEGEMTEDVAKEFARLRNQYALDQQRYQRESEQFRIQQEEEHRRQHISSIQQAVISWEKQVRKSDPDFDAKMEMTQALIRAEVMEKPPRTPDEGVEIARRAYDQVTSTMAKFRPRPATQANPNSLQSMSGAKPEPSNLGELVRMVARR